jgi:hypothetical protein
MKKLKLSIIVTLSIAGAAFSAFTPATPTPPPTGWYAQHDNTLPYETNQPVSLTDVNANCPVSTPNICAVEFDMNGAVKTIRKSLNNYP